MSVEQTFVGQEKGLEDLFSCLEQTVSGQSQVAFVTGETGAGKTRLVDEFLTRACEKYEDILIARGECYPYTVKTGYFSIQRAFEDLLSGKKADKRLSSVINKVAKFTWDYAPELIGVFLPPASPAIKKLEEVLENSFGLKVGEGSRFASPWTEKTLDPHQVWDQFSRLLTILAADNPIVIFIDDLHWADVESLGLLAYLGRNLEGRILITGTYRPHDVNLGRDGGEHPLLQVRRDLLKAHCLQEVAVSPLPVLHYVSQNYEPNTFPLEFVSFLERQTEGNAFFLTELLTDMKEQGILQRTNGHWCLIGAWADRLPETIGAVLEGRLSAERVGDEARTALVIASVEGNDFTAQVIACVQEMTETKTIQLLAEQLDRRHQIIQVGQEREAAGDTLDLYGFRHSLFQHFLYDGLDRAQRRLLHAKVGEALEALYAGEEERAVLDLARHFREARDWARLSKYALAAAKQQAEAYSFQEAKRWCQEGRTAIAKLPQSEETQRRLVELLLEQGKAEQVLTDVHEAMQLYHEAESILAELEDDSIAGKTYFLLGKALYETKEWDKALDYLSRSLELWKKLEDGEGCADVLQTTRYIYKKRLDRRYEDFLALCEDVMAMNERAGNSLANVDVLNVMGDVFDDRGRSDRAAEVWTNGLQIAREFHDRAKETKMLRRVARALRELGQLDESLAYYEESRSLASELSKPKIEAMALAGMAITYRYKGDLESALQCREKQLEIRKKIGDIKGVASALGSAGLLLSRLGRREEALQKYRDGLEIREKHGYIRAAEASRNNIAAILKQWGRFEEALVEFERLLEAGRQTNDLGRISITLNHIGHIYGIQGRTREALEKHKEALEIITSREYQEDIKEEYEVESPEDEEGKFIGRQAITLRYMSEAYYELGELEKSLQCCTNALEISRSRGDIVGEGKALYHMGITLLAQGDVEAAVGNLSKALIILEKREPRWLGTVKNGLALAHTAQRDHQTALAYAQGAVAAFESTGSYRLGDARFTCAKVYSAMDDKEKALVWVDLAREKFREMGLKHRVDEVDEFRQKIALEGSLD